MLKSNKTQHMTFDYFIYLFIFLILSKTTNINEMK